MEQTYYEKSEPDLNKNKPNPGKNDIHMVLKIFLLISVLQIPFLSGYVTDCILVIPPP